jgi:hypothetical protein
MSYLPGAGYPDLATIRAWLKSPATVLPDDELAMIAGAEQTNQTHLLAWPTDADLPDDLAAAFLRRCARHAAAKNIPLGILGADAEYGAVRLSRWESEVDRLEAPYYVPVIA